tara:strand:- start:1276 stop:1482 length:207 start_codon:yes stop_codon:yes gene_type:complete
LRKFYDNVPLKTGGLPTHLEIVRTHIALAHDLVPREATYLKTTLTEIANGHPQSCIDNLLPMNFQPSS